MLVRPTAYSRGVLFFFETRVAQMKISSISEWILLIHCKMQQTTHRFGRCLCEIRAVQKNLYKAFYENVRADFRCCRQCTCGRG